MRLPGAVLDFLSRLRGRPGEADPSSPRGPHEDLSMGEMREITLRDAHLSGWFHHETAELLEGFPITPEDSVLDAGCGDGTFVRFCAEHGAEVYFADIDEERVRAVQASLADSGAKAVHPLVTNCAPVPMGDATVSKVVAMEVLEHVDDPAAFMAELVRVARPGAQFLLTVPDALIESAQKKIAPAEHFQPPNHVRVFEREAFEKLVLDAGLVVERRTYYGFYWSIWWCLFWACDHDLADPWHPALRRWTQAWSELMDTPQGPRMKRLLDEFMPKSQAILARKP